MSLERKLKGFLSKQGVSFQLGKKSFISNCINPACGKEDKLYIRKNDGQTICFKCGETWNWRMLVGRIAGVPYRDAYRVLHGEGAGDVIENALDLKFILSEGEEELDRMIAKPKPIMLGPDFVPYKRAEAAVEYLRKRGVTDERLMDSFDLRYQAMMNAVVFPVMNGENIYGWQARKIEVAPGGLRMLTMSGFDKSKFLLGQKGIIGKKKLVLVEGPFDCLHVCVDEFYGLASLGKAVSQEQIKILLDSDADEIYLGLDRDAFNEVYDVIDDLGMSKTVFRITPPKSKKDFGECTADEVRESIGRAASTTAPFLELYFKEEK